MAVPQSFCRLIGWCTTHLPSPTTWDVSRSPRRGGRQTIRTRGVCKSALKLPHRWAGPRSDKWRAEPRSEPDSGNPTVRDPRTALRNVTSHASGVLVRALNFEPDNRMHGSTGAERYGVTAPAPDPTNLRWRRDRVTVGAATDRRSQSCRRETWVQCSTAVGRDPRDPLGEASQRERYAE
jgi:hypothetical protein